ncbi:MAG TPA: SusC/RagA family TonB-linked outer membrane protein [Flavisolibacter sp.]|nr:SusC/RagA family TonB-linked outer membrane protein [Flavisolibacter sp.]
MKLFAILFLGVLLTASRNGFAQRITIAQKNIPVSRVFSIIQHQSDFSLLYDNQLLKQTKNISINMKEASVEEVLDYCLKDLPLTYVITGKIIVIKEKAKEEKADPLLPQMVAGTVKDEGNNKVEGATVSIKELSLGTQTNVSGDFLFANVPAGNYTLEVSFIGFTTERKPFVVFKEPRNLSITLKAAEDNLQEVTVTTALGISKKAAALTYSTQTITNEDLTTVKNTNVVNSLNGKVAGIQINRTSGGAGGSARVVLRGDKSARNSQPLYVIDGMPIVNPTGGPVAGLYNGSPDGGDIISTLNPDDIETINVLKGASASALYGSQGSNGVILITTKKGTTGTTRIDFSSTINVDRAFLFPKQQYAYAQSTPQTGSAPGSADSWGGKGTTQPDNNYIKDFFQTGTTFINSISLSAATDRAATYFSYSNTNNKGILPTSTFRQNTLGFRQSSKFLQDRLTINGTFFGSIQNVHNRAVPGVYFNPLTGLYLFPRGLDFNAYKAYEYFSPSRYLYAQNWWNINADKSWIGEDYQQNPYWVVNRNNVNTKNQNIYASLSLNYLLNDWLNLQARGNINNFITENRRDIYATTQATLAFFNGTYTGSRSNNTTLYGDLLLTAHKKLTDKLDIDITAGTSIQDQKGKTLSIEGEPSVPNVFSESALNRNNISILNTAVAKQIQSVFGNVQLDYKSKIFLDFSNRNDWSSTFAFTPTERSGYNYYSIGAAGILSKLFRLPATVDFAKFRISYAIVGNDIAPFSTNPLYSFNAGIATPPSSSPVNIPGYFLKPEKNKALEAGTQWSLFKARLTLDLTWYKSNITNQYFQGITVPPGLGTGGFADINSGDIQNSGLEIIGSYKVINQRSFSWKSTLNLSHNSNKIKKLFNSDIVANPSPDQIYRLTGGNGEEGVLRLGGSYNDIYGRAFMRDAKGRIVVNASTGIPYFVDNKYLGNPNPRIIVGWKNSFEWKDISFDFLVDGKFGGKVISITEAYADQLGVSERTGQARNNGNTLFIANAVDENGNAWQGATEVNAYYKQISGKTPVGEAYMYNATSIRLREFSMVYTFPLAHRAVKKLSAGVIGNNLFFFHLRAPFDPEQVAGVNPGGVGVDAFGLPAWRTLGFVLFATF